jgi:hypothetical protein
MPSTRKSLAALAVVGALLVGAGQLAVSTVCACAPPKPEAQAWPAITGTATVDEALGTTNGTWVTSGNLAGHPVTSYAYQWQRCTSVDASTCANIGSATASTYTLVSGDADKYIRAVVTATNDGGATPQASLPTGPVADNGGAAFVGTAGVPSDPCTTTLSSPSSATVNTALQGAAAGAVVCVSGTVSGTLALSSIAPSSNITLASCAGACTTAGAGATIPDMTLSSVSKLTVEGFVFSTTRTCSSGVANPFLCSVEGTGAVSNTVFQYNTIQNQSRSYSFQFQPTSGSDSNLSFLYNQIDHVGSCLNAAGAVSNVTFSDNVCGPDVGAGLTNADLTPGGVTVAPQHYIQLAGVDNVLVDHNAFEGPYNATTLTLTGSGGYTGGVHSNVFHDFGGASNVTFSNNIMWHTQSRGNTFLMESNSPPSQTNTGISLINNLGVEDSATCNTGNCASNNEVDGPQSSTFTHNTFDGYFFGLMLGCNSSSNLVSGYDCGGAPGTNAGMTTEYNISVPTVVGIGGTANWYHFHCDTSCVTSHNVSGDATAPAGTGQVLNWTPAYTTTSWTPADGTAYQPPPTGYYIATGAAAGDGYEGGGGPEVVAPPTPPTNTAVPTISGTPQQGQTLTEVHGTWDGAPTSYTYQWRECNSSGASCSNAPGSSTSQTYGVSSSNTVGDTIRVVEVATNSAGDSSPATSAQTAQITASGGGGNTVVGVSAEPAVTCTGSHVTTTAALLTRLDAASAGNVICLDAGSYSQLNTDGNLTFSSPGVTIAGVPGASVTMAGAIFHYTTTNVIVQGITFTSSVIFAANATNNTVQYDTIHNFGGRAVNDQPTYHNNGPSISGTHILYDQIDHVSDCYRATGDVSNTVFSHNVCGPGIGNGGDPDSHYMQSAGVNGLTVTYNAFEGPYDLAALGNGPHNNVSHAGGAGITFSNNIVWHSQSKAQTLLWGDEGMGAVTGGTGSNNLFIEDDTGFCTTHDCPTYSMESENAYGSSGVTFNNNTVGVNQSTGTDAGGILVKAGQTSVTVQNNLVFGTSGTGGSNYALDVCNTCSGNVSQDGSGNSTWSPTWCSDDACSSGVSTATEEARWTPTDGSPWNPPPTNYFKPFSGVAGTVGYQGTINGASPSVGP